MFPIDNPATQLEGWERELVWMEILVLTGSPNASFRHLARAWGRDKGFHMVLAQFICERHGDVQRKKRQGEAAAAAATSNDPNRRSQPPKKRKIMHPKNRKQASNQQQEPGVISADIWDDSAYGDANTNEELAAGIFNFSSQELDTVATKYHQAAATYSDSESLSSPQPSAGHSANSSLSSQAAVKAILGEGGQPAAPQLAQPPPPSHLTPPNLAKPQQQHQHTKHERDERNEQRDRSTGAGGGTKDARDGSHALRPIGGRRGTTRS